MEWILRESFVVCVLGIIRKKKEKSRDKWTSTHMVCSLHAFDRFTAYPEGDVRDAEAYKGAIDKLPKRSVVISEPLLLSMAYVSCFPKQQD